MSRNTRGGSKAILAVIALAFLAELAIAEGTTESPGPVVVAPDERAVLIFPAIVQRDDSADADEAATFGTSLINALEKAFSDLSFNVSIAPIALVQGEGLPAEASSNAVAVGARWAVIISLEIANKRIAYSLRVYEASETALVASSGFSSYAGLTALPLFADSAKAVATKTAALQHSPSNRTTGPIQYRITIESPDEGAAVVIGTGGAWGSRNVGIIESGSLVLPYIPFQKGTDIVVGLSKKDMVAIDVPIELGDEEPRIVIPALRKKEKENLLVGTGPGRLLGVGVTYRIFTRPDWDFIFFNERIFAGYDFSPGSIPLIHMETWEGLGWYLLFPPKSPFRMGACLGGGILFSVSSASSPTSNNSVFVDAAIIPIEGFMEYRFRKGPTLWLSVRGAFSINSSGLIGQGWMGGGQPDLTAGLLWRR